jgi:hypothetical protein
MKYQAREHAVEAVQIQAVGAISQRGQLLHPDEGLMLTLSDNSKRTWMIEGDVTPKIGDWLVIEARRPNI